MSACFVLHCTPASQPACCHQPTWRPCLQALPAGRSRRRCCLPRACAAARRATDSCQAARTRACVSATMAPAPQKAAPRRSPCAAPANVARTSCPAPRCSACFKRPPAAQHTMRAPRCACCHAMLRAPRQRRRQQRLEQQSLRARAGVAAPRRQPSQPKRAVQRAQRQSSKSSSRGAS